MITLPTRARLASFLAVLLVLPFASSTATPGAARRAGPTVAHRDGRAMRAKGLPKVQTTSIDHLAGEPTLAIEDDGSIFYAAIDVPQLAKIDILRSADSGATWTNASPKLAGQNLHPISIDPYVHIDEVSQRVFTIDLTVACSYLSFTDDSGETWTTNPLACGRPINDHQTLISGPPVSSAPLGFSSVLYYCWNDVFASSCTKSIDGGSTFIPTGEPAFLGVDPAQGPGVGGVPGVCGGLHGHGFVDAEGALYIPRDYCGNPWLAISRDEGLTWERVQVADNGVNGIGGGGSNPSVTVDDAGNIYFGWVAANHLPYIATSSDAGATWSEPIQVGVPGLHEANLFTIDSGASGTLAFSYMGSLNSKYQECYPDCVGATPKTTWNGYVGMTSRILAAKPLIYTGTVNDPADPLKVGTCGPGRCGDTILDFLDIVVGPDGVVNAAFVDACIDCTVNTLVDSGNEGLFVRFGKARPHR
ncbi:MAG TPA: hypothetical protein VNC78_07205 [Actinomycetota bacterium]|nr:hypothetical protein [Actinomycetota bacterium]